jgi:putative Mn2+ efflux pump MntP
LVVLVAIAVTIVRATTGVTIEFDTIEKVATALAVFGTTLMPLLVLFASWIAKQTYKNLLKGVWKIGFSHTKL